MSFKISKHLAAKRIAVTVANKVFAEDIPFFEAGQDLKTAPPPHYGVAPCYDIEIAGLGMEFTPLYYPKEKKREIEVVARIAGRADLPLILSMRVYLKAVPGITEDVNWLVRYHKDIKMWEALYCKDLARYYVTPGPKVAVNGPL